MYPENDQEFEEATISEVKGNGKGWEILRDNGWSFWVPPESPVEPKQGMNARFYGKGTGARVRGLFLNGGKVFYRTEAEDKEQAEIELYGKDSQAWLDQWDAGHTVWTIEMGGLGPGYEQAIQITVAEILRHLLVAKYDASKWEDGEEWKRDRDAIEQMGYKNPIIKKLGLSGAQWGAALNLAALLYRKGPRAIMTDEQVKDRHIQVCRDFP